MNFASDNTTGMAPEIHSALADVNNGALMPYGEDDLTRQVERRITELFETDVGVLLVSTGTASNALALASMSAPYSAIFCRRGAHIEASEGGAVEHLSGGACLVPLEGPDGKLGADDLDRAVAGHDPAARFSHATAVSLTQATELGTVYTLDEIASLSDVARRHGLKVHLDGARWANAVASLGCTPADASWRAGVDVLSFGATKNGVLAGEAVVFFDRSLMRGAPELRKRAGMLWSKHRFLAAQWQAYLQDDLWLVLAGRANTAAASLARGLSRVAGAELQFAVEANEVFVCLPDAIIAALEVAGYRFYRRGGGVIRLVTSFATSVQDVDGFLEIVGKASATSGPRGE